MLRSLARGTRDWLRRQARLRTFRRQFADFERLAGDGARLPLRWEDRLPCLDDRTATTAFDAHYVYHTAWAARCVAALRPAEHVDVSSSLYFCSLISAFVPVRFYDYRPAALSLSGLSTAAADLTHLPFANGSLPSLSCMHVVEHIGLGRYGDPLDADGDLKAIAELQRVLAPGGSLLFVVPVGRPKVVFNAHRIYATRQVREAFAGLALRSFALVTDGPDAEWIEDASEGQADAQSYGCGCFRFEKP
jgi:SAM-dependent methyltransferase